MLDTANDGRRRKEGISNILLLGKVEEKQYVMDSEERRRKGSKQGMGGWRREKGKGGERGKRGKGRGEREFFLSHTLSPLSLTPPFSFLSSSLPAL